MVGCIPMSKPVPTDDALAVLVAKQSYGIVKTSRQSDGATDLPEWEHIPGLKQTYLTNAARAALNGSEVWDIWAISCGETPNDATPVLWRQKPDALQLLPRVYEAFGKAVSFHTKGEIPGPSEDLLEDEVPSLFEETEQTDSGEEEEPEKPVAIDFSIS